MKHLLLLCLVCTAATVAHADTPAAPSTEETPATQSSPAMPQGTLAVARIKSFGTLGQAWESLKSWVKEHPSVESLWDEEWAQVEKINLPAEAARALDMTPEEFAEYLDGPVTLWVGADWAWAKDSQMLPVAIELTAASPESAQELLDRLKNDEGVLETSQPAEGVEYLKIQVDEAPAEASTPASAAHAAQPKTMDMWVALDGKRLLVGNQLDYTLKALQAPNAPTTPQSSGFWAKVASSDVAIWMAPQALISKIKEQLAAKGDKARITPQMIDELGLGQIEGVGLWAQLSPLRVQMELSWSPNSSPLSELLGCAPTGLQASPLVPEDVQEFSLGRMDASCTWTQLRQVMKTLMPATETIYQGWQEQLQTSQGVDLERQLWGALGSQYVLYTRGDATLGEDTAIYIAVNDAVGLQGAMEGIITFLAQGKEMFDREKLGNITVWRLKNELQAPSTPPLAWAVTPQWLIISLGDPTQMQELIENTSATSPTHPAWATPSVQQALALPGTTSLSRRPLKIVLTQLAAAVLQVNARKTASSDLPEAPLPEDIPSFDDVNEEVLATTEMTPGRITTTLQVLSPHE